MWRSERRGGKYSRGDDDNDNDNDGDNDNDDDNDDDDNEVSPWPAFTLPGMNSQPEIRKKMGVLNRK